MGMIDAALHTLSQDGGPLSGSYVNVPWYVDVCFVNDVRTRSCVALQRTLRRGG